VKVGILLSGRYPTEKAYGVTTNGTIKSLVRAGHQVIVIAMASDYSEEPPVTREMSILKLKESSTSRYLKILAFSNFGFINKVAWKLYWVNSKLLNRKKISDLNLDVLWIRDFHMFKFSFAATRLVLEIHQSTEALKFRRLLRIKRLESIVFAPISRILLEEIQKVANKDLIQYSPMGIDSQMIATPIETSDFVSSLKRKIDSKPYVIEVGYVGKFFPSGYSKGIEDLIALSQLNKGKAGNLHVSITGGTESEVYRVEQLISEYDLTTLEFEINPHVSHTLAMEKLRKLDVIVLPEPKSEKYVGFPLKSIEAVASGRIVMAADCRVYKDVFTDQYQPYWFEPGERESLYNAIQMAIFDNDLEDHIHLGIDYARRFTWDTRTSDILKKLNQRIPH
jgi:glycosyltransferase involved in cell wall biosynthesis